MCRNIRVLFNFEPPASADECHAAALQYVRKVSGTTAKRPSKANEEAFDRAVAQIASITTGLIGELTTPAAPKNREQETAKRRAISAKRFSR